MIQILIQIRNLICVLYLIVFAIFETYSALATALDNFRRSPAWEAKLGWGLLVLPSLLMIGLVLLRFGKRLTLGFSLVASSVLLYMGFLSLELALVGKIDRTEWPFIGLWATLCAIATAAAWLLSRRSTQP
jgi:lipopolysaccharide export LptBFGC system permease protein LptF